MKLLITSLHVHVKLRGCFTNAMGPAAADWLPFEVTKVALNVRKVRLLVFVVVQCTLAFCAGLVCWI